MLELDCSHEFDASADDDFFGSLPAQPAVCLIELREATAEPLLIRTQDLVRRLQRLLGHPDPNSKRLNLRGLAVRVRYRLTASPFEQIIAYYQNASLLFPHRYRKLLRLRSPALLRISLRNAYPRCYVTRRIPSGACGQPLVGAYYGPFATRRSAAEFAESVLDFFKVRRCQIKIRRDPAFPGCIYSEMKMCLAPCFGGCSKEDYDAEVQRLLQFLETGGESLRASFEKERERASEEQDFERAASIHKKIQKLQDVLRGQPEIARRIQNLDAVILQRAAEAQCIAVFPLRGGRLADPLFLRFAQMASQPRSAEQLLRDHLDHTQPLAPSVQGMESADLSEHLSLVARWYYGNPREGEIFFREKDWPYRRILRGCSRLLAAENRETQSASSRETIEPLPPNQGSI
ncbi:MAG: hypothetical protein NVS9B4_18000 [Candidatus Acidiferrum sp.]